jgi:hypothetical protein
VSRQTGCPNPAPLTASRCQIAGRDGPPSPPGEKLDARGGGVGQPQVVRRGDAVNKGAHFAVAGRRIDNIVRRWRGRLSAKAVDAGDVIQAAAILPTSSRVI